MLNWRRDPGYEQSNMLSELPPQQIENDILLVESEIARFKSDNEQPRGHRQALPPSTPLVEGTTFADCLNSGRTAIMGNTTGVEELPGFQLVVLRRHFR